MIISFVAGGFQPIAEPLYEPMFPDLGIWYPLLHLGNQE